MSQPNNPPSRRQLLPNTPPDLYEILASATKVFGLFGYQHLRLPSLDSTDIYTQGTGEDFRDLMYIFSDPGGQEVCLRPEWTLAVARYFLREFVETPLPRRLSYIGPVYRYTDPGDTRPREFLQMGAEFLDHGPELESDVEALALPLRILQHVGVSDFFLRMNDLRLLREFLTLVAPQVFPADSFPLGMLRSHALEQFLGDEQAPVASLTERPSGAESDDLRSLLARSDSKGSAEILAKLINFLHGTPRGTRNAEEIAENFLFQIRQATTGVLAPEQQELIRSFLRIDGSPETVMAELDELCAKAGVRKLEWRDYLMNLVGHVSALGLDADRIQLRLGMRRGIRYYTGFLFDYRRQLDDGTLRLCGGGRYDELLASVGSTRPVPAIGFAFVVDRLVDAVLEDETGDRTARPTLVRIHLQDPQKLGQALGLAERLRSLGLPTCIDENRGAPGADEASCIIELIDSYKISLVCSAGRTEASVDIADDEFLKLFYGAEGGHE